MIDLRVSDGRAWGAGGGGGLPRGHGGILLYPLSLFRRFAARVRCRVLPITAPSWGRGGPFNVSRDASVTTRPVTSAGLGAHGPEQPRMLPAGNQGRGLGDLHPHATLPSMLRFAGWGCRAGGSCKKKNTVVCGT